MFIIFVKNLNIRNPTDFVEITRKYFYSCQFFVLYVLYSFVLYVLYVLYSFWIACNSTIFILYSLQTDLTVFYGISCFTDSILQV